MIHSFTDLLLNLTNSWGYFGIFFLITVESSFIPFPSEVVIPPAAYLAYGGEMNIFLVILFGILGSLAGASINYFLAYYLGRPLVFTLVEKKWAKWFLLSRSKVERADNYFLKYGNVSTFLGRLLPGIRQLISIPAGFSAMNFKHFILYTFLGSGLWVCVLAGFGYFLGANTEMLNLYYKQATIFIVLGVFILVFGWLLVRYFRKKR